MSPLLHYLESDSKGDGGIQDEVVEEDDVQHLPTFRIDVQQYGNDERSGCTSLG